MRLVDFNGSRLGELPEHLQREIFEFAALVPTPSAVAFNTGKPRGQLGRDFQSCFFVQEGWLERYGAVWDGPTAPPGLNYRHRNGWSKDATLGLGPWRRAWY